MAVFHRGVRRASATPPAGCGSRAPQKVRSGMTFRTADCGRQTVEAPGPTSQTASGHAAAPTAAGPGTSGDGDWVGGEEWRKGEARGRRLAASVRPGIFAAPGERTYIHNDPGTGKRVMRCVRPLPIRRRCGRSSPSIPPPPRPALASASPRVFRAPFRSSPLRAASPLCRNAISSSSF